MSEDLIRRSDAIIAIRERLDSPHMQNALQQGACLSILRAIENAPTIEPKRGRWIRTFDGNEWYWYCSNCKNEWYEDDLYMGGNEFPNFCPNCGADMRPKEGE